MFWNISTLISTFATLVFGAIFTLVLNTKPRTQLRRIFGLYLLAMSMWSISAFLTTAGIVTVLPWFRMMGASPIGMMLAIFYFVQTLFGLRRKWAPLTLVYGILAISITLFSEAVVKSAFLDQTGVLHYQLGPLFLLVAAPGYFLIIISLLELVRGYKKTHDANNRNRIRYLIIGLSITILASFVNFTKLGKYPIDVAANGITAIIIAYAILRHQLLEIRVAIRLGLLYSFTTALFGAIYYLSISLVLNIFQLIAGQEIFIVSLLVGSLTVFILSPLRNQAQIWIDRLFYREKYNAGLMLQRLSQTTASLMDLKRITSLILSEVISTLHISHGAILIKSHDSGDYQVIADFNSDQNIELGFRADHPIAAWMSRENKALTREDISMIPTFKSLWGDEKEVLEKFKAELFIPLITKGDLVGLLVLGQKRSSQPYNHEDLLILSALANQTAVAIENARLYDELERSFVQTVVALANAIDIRDSYTITHSQQIADWAAETARVLGCSSASIKDIFWGGLLHDIGKIGIPDSILGKPAQLNESEWEVIRKHPRLGAELIAPINKLSEVAPLIKYSHERFDGYGYPYGLKGEEIPLGARIISVADSFSAMMDERPYKKPYTTERALNELRNNSNKMYDPVVVEAFLKMVQHMEPK
jgi:HD-GYP domain-containing protein (c-di-GMP phosphodiesterase class II)